MKNYDLGILIPMDNGTVRFTLNLFVILSGAERQKG
jgi:hypothetical protein